MLCCSVAVAVGRPYESWPFIRAAYLSLLQATGQACDEACIIKAEGGKDSCCVGAAGASIVSCPSARCSFYTPSYPLQALDNYLLHRRGDNAPHLDLVLALLTDVARGLEYLHSKNIIHGDLKVGAAAASSTATSGSGIELQCWLAAVAPSSSGGQRQR